MDQKRRNRVIKLVKLLSSSSQNEKFNSLVEIRKNVLKSKEGISLLSECGGIPKIVQILCNDNETKAIDITLSILGNLCMESDARKMVKKANGIEAVANVFIESKEESVQNRSSRTLANLALTHENIGLILKTDTVENLAKLLQSSETKENILTYSRTTRLLASNTRQLEKLLSENVILHLAKHLQNSHDEVKFSVLRSVFELSTISCSPGFASQIVSSGILPDLLLLLHHHDDTVVHQSVTLIHRLSHQPNFRPGLGSAGGITTILDLFQNEENLIDKNILLNILCMCCKESVNRIRIRDNGILQVFLVCLSNDNLSPLHDKLISAIQCFVYYDASISLLLEHGLVKTLIKHLQRVAGFQSVVCSVEDLIPTFINGDEITEELKKDEGFFHRLYQLPLHGHYSRQNLASQKSSKTKEIHQSGDEMNDRTGCEEKPKPIYSIDSPTYIAHSNWDLDEYLKGNKCKQIFSKTSPDTDYSILSTMSYCTPKNSPSSERSPATSSQYVSSPSNFSFTSPGCSGWSGSEGSPEYLNSGSTVNRDPKYGMVCSMPYTCDSPVKFDSPMELSPISSPTGLSHTEEFSSCESDNEEFVNDSSKNKMEVEKDEDKDCKQILVMDEELLKVEDVTAMNEVKVTVDQLKITIDQPDETMESIADRDISTLPEQGKQKTKSSKMKRSSEDENYTSLENAPKRQKLCSPDQDCNISNRSHETENQILILLSRVSQMNDPSLFLVTIEIICCLLDYLTKVNNPQPRAARILSRIAKNPLCFEKLLKFRFIPLVYYKFTLYKYEDRVNALAQTDKCVLQRPGVKKSVHKRRSGSLGLDSMNRNEPVYSFLEDEKQSADSNKKVKNIKASKQGLSSKDADIVDKDENSNFKARVGLTLLQDMCIQADSYFGRGEVEHMRHQNPEFFNNWLPVDLIYVLWLSGMQDYYFSQLNFLESVLDVIQQNEATQTPKYQAAVQGLSFLGKMVNLHMNSETCNPEDNFVLYQTNDCLPTEIMDTDEKEQEIFCNFQSLKISNKVEFLVENKRLVCCRDVLSKSCPLFTAMLHGEFLEANQETVLIEDTSFYAFQYLVHYLHNCSLKCEIISQPLKCDITKESLNNCLEVFSLALKYMIGTLQTFLLSVLSKQLMSADTACHVFHFALLHDFSDLADDSVICVTKKGDNYNRMKGLCKFLYGINREAFVMTLKDLFKS